MVCAQIERDRHTLSTNKHVCMFVIDYHLPFHSQGPLLLGMRCKDVAAPLKTQGSSFSRMDILKATVRVILSENPNEIGDTNHPRVHINRWTISST